MLSDAADRGDSLAQILLFYAECPFLVPLPFRGNSEFWLTGWLATDQDRPQDPDAEVAFGRLEPLGPGLWRSRALGHLVWLVSSIDLLVEVDSLPLHVVGREPLATEREVARLVVGQSELQ